jgi:hypothetical protein
MHIKARDCDRRDSGSRIIERWRGHEARKRFHGPYGYEY